jgi:hypothetical protein
MSFAAAAPSGYCLKTSHPRRPSTIIFAPGVGWNVGEDARRPTQASAGAPEEKSSTERRDSRFPVGQDYRGRWRPTWLRWSQEGQRKKAPFAGRYTGIGARSVGPRRTGARPRWHKAPARTRENRSSKPHSPVAGDEMGQGVGQGRGRARPEGAAITSVRWKARKPSSMWR